MTNGKNMIQELVGLVQLVQLDELDELVELGRHSELFLILCA